MNGRPTLASLDGSNNSAAGHLRQNHDGQLACGALLNVLERHPQVEFGTPGQLMHTIECYRDYYEAV